jgi:hypothetical protein
MAEMGPREYASRYWDMEVPIINDDNELLKWQPIKFNKYRLYGWPNDVAPPGHSEFLSAVQTYATKLFKQGKALLLRVKNIWGEPHYISISTIEELRKSWWKATAAFSGKGSPEDVQLTLQLAVRCGVVAKAEELQAYCDKKVDAYYSRLGLDCNGFVGNYLQYRSDSKKWNWEAPKAQYGPDTGIKDLIGHFAGAAITDTEAMRSSRIFLLGLVDPATNQIINQYSTTGGVGHIVITEPINWGSKAVYPPVPPQYLNGRYIHYSTVESTPGAGLSASIYGILNINGSSVATVWRNISALPPVLNIMNVKICPLI